MAVMDSGPGGAVLGFLSWFGLRLQEQTAMPRSACARHARGVIGPVGSWQRLPSCGTPSGRRRGGHRRWYPESHFGGRSCTPSCPINPTMSTSTHISAILPLWIRRTVIALKAIALPVGGTPWNSPRCVPRFRPRNHTRFPSAPISSTRCRKSGKAARIWPATAV